MKQLLIVLVLALMNPGTSSAQKQGQFGFNLSVNSGPSIGVIYHVSDRFAFRPFVSYSKTTVERTYTYFDGFREISMQLEQKNKTYGGGLSGLLYFPSSNEFTIYLGAGISYFKSVQDVFDFSPSPEQLKSDNISLSGSLGLQYAVSKNFSVYGEIGFDYITGDIADDVSINGLSTHNSGIGIILYLK
jgi:opacity protein-like surface antigen